MAKCIVMKLNESVNNPDLIGINEMSFQYKKRSDDIDAVPLTISNTSSTPYELRMVGDGHFTDSTGETDLGQSINIAPGGNSVYITNDDAVLTVGNKYHLSAITANVGMSIANGNLPGEGFIIDTGKIKYMSALNSIYLLAGGLIGNIEDLAPLTLLSALSVSAMTRQNSLVGDISALSGLTSLSYVSVANQSGITGDISAFTDVPLTYLSTIGTQIYGDLSDLADKKTLRYVGGAASMDFQWSDDTSRASDAYVMALNEINLKDDVDNYLIANAPCEKHPDIDSIVLWGTRTSASDTALATIKAKGITVILNREEL